jgi:hypothetical protein
MCVIAIESGEVLALSRFGIVFCGSLKECVLENIFGKQYALQQIFEV